MMVVILYSWNDGQMPPSSQPGLSFTASLEKKKMFCCRELDLDLADALKGRYEELKGALLFEAHKES